MSSSLEKLNLRPGERRLLVAIGIALFIALNVMFVRPKFGEFGRVRVKTSEIQGDIDKFQREIDKKPAYTKQLQEMEGQGSKILKEEQSLRMLQTVQSQALASGFTINSVQQQTSFAFSNSTNAFFDEQALVISYDTGYRQLITFLVGLADHESMIRVRNMDVKTDPSHQRLQGIITLVASFQRNRPNATAAPAAVQTHSTAQKK
jgi:Tfp pilus assembly protein PilO